MDPADIEVWYIEIEDAKADYIAKYNVFPEDVDEVHSNRPRYILRKADWNLIT